MDAMIDNVWLAMMGIEAAALLCVIAVSLVKGRRTKRAPLHLITGDIAKLVLWGIALLALAVFLLSALARGK